MRLPGRKAGARLLAVVLGVGLGLSGSVLAFAVTGSPSSFESGDGNMVLNTSGNTDWNCFVNSDNFAHNGATPAGCKVTTGALQITADGSGEVQWVSGQKFDTLCPALNIGNNPPKDEFTNVASFSDTDTSLNTFFYGATIRSTANGNASGDVEFNQTSGNGTTTAGCRTAGDRLLAYDYLNGGTSLNFHILTWIDSTNLTAGGNSGLCFVKTDSPPCWGANVITVSPALFDGESNQAAITAANNGISNTALAINQFAEFGINLTSALNLGGQCFSFPQQVWESRSSGSSFTSNPQDIEVEHNTINNCGEVVIIKHTDPRGVNQGFSYTSNLAGSQMSCTQPTATAFSLNDAGNSAADSAANTQDCTFVPNGSYTVSEGAEPTGFSFESLSCTATGAGTSATPSGVNANITIAGGGKVVCTYVNQPLANLIIKKITNPSPDLTNQSFPYTTTGGLTPSTFSLTNGGVKSYLNIAPGSYSVTEGATANWSLTSAICDNGNNPQLSITLAAGQTVTCTFTNTIIPGAIRVVKVTNPSDTTTLFPFTPNNFNANAGFNLTGGGSQTFSGIAPSNETANTYSVGETTPNSWTLVGATCDNGTPSNITVVSGQTTTCTFTNEQGAIKISKSSIKGTALAGATFSIVGPNTSTSVVTGSDGTVCLGHLAFGSYAVTETAAPAGYSIDNPAPQTATVLAPSACGDGNEATVSASDTPLTDLTITVTSEAVGGTRSTITCVDSLSANIGNSPSGLGGTVNVTALGLKPGTYTCTVVVDP